MGASGTGIFCDDVACDVRAQFRGSLADDKTAAEARRSVLRDWRPALEDEDDGPVIWLALAATQCRYGCLEKQVRAKALAIIDSGKDLERWRATADQKWIHGRKAAL